MVLKTGLIIDKHVSKKDHENCNNNWKKSVFYHENIAYQIIIIISFRLNVH